MTTIRAPGITPPSRNRACRLPELVRRHPVTALLLWFFTVGQAVAFIPVVSHLNGVDVAITPFVLASNLVGLLLPTLLITHVTGGAVGLRMLWRRITAVRVGPGWYAYALVVVPLTTVGVAAALFGLPRGTSLPALGAAVVVGLLIPTVLGLVTSNLGEEVAWMGFVQARLQDRRGPLVAALLTAPLFALQHLPLVVSNAGSGAPLLLLLLVLLAVPFRALIGWSYNRTQSLLLVGLVHASGNAVAGGTMLGDGLLQRLYPEVSTGPLHIFAFAVLGLLVLGATRARLGLPRGHARGRGPRMP
ncbi:CPBP family intramembrane glutamic endopeptidase [Blastococcus sp. SYSU DS0669]